MRRSLLAVCIVLFWSIGLWAQQTAQISGTVRDTSGAAVPGASVSITQTDTQESHSITAGPDGGFLFQNLALGPYRLQVTKEGFTTYIQTGIVLQVNSNPEVNPVLQVGAVSQQVQVNANAAMVETHEDTVGEVIDSQRVVDLPLNGRQVSQLITLSGVSSINTSSALSTNYRTYPNAVAISVAGTQNNGTLFLLDGGLNMDPGTNVPMLLPFPDAIQEFKLETTDLPAQYGYHAGAAVSVVTKSGTNQFHGSAFEFVRNGDMNARNYFAPVRDSLKRNQFGGTAGGRIIKDKLFVFGAYQSTIIRTNPQTNVAYTPTAAVLDGNFSAFTSSACSNGKVSLNAAEFPGQQISPSLFNQQALNLLKYLPVSTNPCGEILYGIVSDSSDEEGDMRVDYQKSEKHADFVRYFVGENNQPATTDPTDVLTSNSSGWSDRDQSLTFGDTYTLSANAVNALRITGTRTAVHRMPPDTLPTPTQVGVNIPQLEPHWILVSVSGYFSFGSASQGPGVSIGNTVDVNDDVQLIRGKHQFGFGGMFVHVKYEGSNNYLPNGQWSWNGSYTGNPLADFMLGDVYTVGFGNGQTGDYRSRYLGLYAQDAWKPTPKLTVNYGVRWEPYFPLTSGNHEFSHFEPSWMLEGIKSTVYPNAPAGLIFPGDKGFPGNSPTFGKLNEWGPRLGIAWDPRGQGRETIRLGYGIIYDQPALWDTSHFSQAPPWGDNITLDNPPGGFTSPFLNYPGYPNGDPFPTVFPPPSNVQFGLFSNYENYPLHVKPTYIQSWNVSLEKQIGKDLLLKASYLGDQTTHLRLGYNANPETYIPGNCTAGQYGLTKAGACSTTANLNYRSLLYLEDPSQGQYFSSTITQIDDGPTANYNAMMLTVNKRLSDEFTALVNYTYDHCFSFGDVTQDTGNNYQNPLNRLPDYANCVQPQQLTNASVIYYSPTTLPSKWENRILGGWQLPVILAYQTGTFSTVTTGLNNSLQGGGGDRPNLVGNPQVSHPSHGAMISHWFNTAAYQDNPVGTYGDVGRDTIRGPGWFDVDVALVRNFNIHEKDVLQFRWENFDATNHTRFDNPGTAMNTATFGTVTTAENPRILQLALKLSF